MSLTSYEIKGMTKRALVNKYRVKSLLEYTHKDKPILSKVLEKNYGLNGTEIRAIIHELRMEGCPIASGGTGYYWAKSYDEIEPTIEHITQRIASLSMIKKALETISKGFSNQRNLF